MICSRGVFTLCPIYPLRDTQPQFKYYDHWLYVEMGKFYNSGEKTEVSQYDFL